MIINTIVLLLIAVTIVLIIAMVFILNGKLKALNANIVKTQRDSEITSNVRHAEQKERIEQLNRNINDTMIQVSKSLGEMRSLASGVDDLKRLMSNVKSRGIIGELQLGAILEDILSPSQYDENVAIKGGAERVEFAVKFPDEDGFVYLPIDSKFPADAYLNLLDAYDIGDREAIKKATDGLRYAILKAAKDIKTKYIYPPLTTDYAIMFLPFEGLYAEVLRMNMVEVLQNEYRINIAGPTTMAAMLNSFQLGFKSIALQQRTSQVWETLEKVKTEFNKFSDVLDRTQKRLEQTQGDLESLIGTRTRTIQRTLNNISELKEKDRNNI